MEYSADLAVMGGGPAGYAAALRAARLNMKVILIEEAKEGGTCLNWGCIPAKSLLYSAALFNKMKDAARRSFRRRVQTVLPMRSRRQGLFSRNFAGIARSRF